MDYSNYKTSHRENYAERINYQITASVDEYEHRERLDIDKSNAVGFMSKPNFYVSAFSPFWRKKDNDTKLKGLTYCNHLDKTIYDTPLKYMMDYELVGVITDNLVYRSEESVTVLIDGSFSIRTPFTYQAMERLICIPECQLIKEIDNFDFNIEMWPDTNEVIGYYWVSYDKFFKKYKLISSRIKNELVKLLTDLQPKDINEFDNKLKTIKNELEKTYRNNSLVDYYVEKYRLIFNPLKSMVEIKNKNGDLSLFVTDKNTIDLKKKVKKLKKLARSQIDISYDCRVIHQDEKSCLIKYNK